MSNMNEYPALKRWCDKYYENTKIRIHPQTVPTQTLMNEILGRLEVAEAALSVFCAQAATDNGKVKEMEDRMKTAEKQIKKKQRIVIKKVKK